MAATTATAIQKDDSFLPPLEANLLSREEVSQMMTKNAVLYVNGANPQVAKLRKDYKCSVGLGICCLIRAGNLDFSDRVIVSKSITIIVILHGAKIDLSRAIFVHPEVSINIVGILGGVKIILPIGFQLKVNGLSIMGGFKDKVSASYPTTTSPVTRNEFTIEVPTIKVRNCFIMGGGSARCDPTSTLVISNE